MENHWDYENIRNTHQKIRWLRPFLDDFHSQILTLPLKNYLKNVWSLPKFFMDKNIPRLTLTSCNASRLHLFRPTGIKIGGGKRLFSKDKLGGDTQAMKTTMREDAEVGYHTLICHIRRIGKVIYGNIYDVITIVTH